MGKWRKADLDDKALYDVTYKAIEALGRDDLKISQIDNIESKEEYGTYYKVSAKTYNSDDDEDGERDVYLHEHPWGISEVSDREESDDESEEDSYGQQHESDDNSDNEDNYSDDDDY